MRRIVPVGERISPVGRMQGESCCTRDVVNRSLRNGRTGLSSGRFVSGSPVSSSCPGTLGGLYERL